MKSMTGHGRGECAQEGSKITVEISSVNRRQSEISVILPRELAVLEAQVRDVVNASVSRGQVTVRIVLHATDNTKTVRVRLNERLARAYVREFKRLAKELDLSGAISLDLVARVPGVLETDGDTPDAEAFWPAMEKALKRALASLVTMREREGASLGKDMAARVARMRQVVAVVQKRAPEVQKYFIAQLERKIQQAGLPAPRENDERLLKELVIFADRSDINEELTRLQSHFKQFDQYARSKEPVGRTLDFLAQEMNREVNTIGSKANDAGISAEVVVLKTEVEKFREQAQNIE